MTSAPSNRRHPESNTIFVHLRRNAVEITSVDPSLPYKSSAGWSSPTNNKKIWNGRLVVLFFFFVFFLILYSSSQVFREWMGGETLALGVTSSEWCYTNKASLVKNLEEKHNLMYVEEAFFSILSFYCAGPYFIFLASPSLLCAFE